MAVTIRTDSRGLDRKLQRLFKVLAPEAMLRLVSAGQLNWVNKNFRDEGTERRWKPLAPGTVHARRRGSSKPLQDTGRMRQSFSQKVRRTVAVVGTNSRLAGIHHGGTRPKPRTPKIAKALTIPNPSGPVRFTKGKLSGKRGFFARSVNHPGIPARPLLPSKALAENMAEKTIEASLRKSLAG